MANTKIEDNEHDRLKILEKVHTSQPEHLENKNKYSQFVQYRARKFVLNKMGERELNRLRAKFTNKVAKQRKTKVFERKNVKYFDVASGQHVKSNIYRMYTTEYELTADQKETLSGVTGYIVSVVERWSHGAPVYAYYSGFRNFDVRELPKVGRLKRTKKAWFFEPLYLFSLQSMDTLKEVQSWLRSHLPRADVSIYPVLSREYYTPGTIYTITCYSKEDATLAKLVLDLQKSEHDMTYKTVVY